MVTVGDGYQQLENNLTRTPVIGDVHPLLPLALSNAVRIVKNGDDVLSEFDTMHTVPQTPILILQRDPRLVARFPMISLREHPPIDEINRNMHFHLEYAREQLLTTHGVGATLVEDVLNHRCDIVVLMLVDGLSYGDVIEWANNTIPCFVDGPSVTYRLANDQATVLPTVGFPSIIGSPSIFSRLHDSGYKNALGYTYWAPNRNVISDYLFNRIPTHRVANFEAILAQLRSFTFKQPTYIQIMREGLDGLAHSKREMSRAEIDGAITSIRQDIERMLEVLSKQKRKVCLYLIADHGILWKTEHEWKTLNITGSRSRYSTSRPDESVYTNAVRYERNSQVYYSFTYPYLGNRIKADDSGVHGGLSYQESIVPFSKFEVR